MAEKSEKHWPITRDKVSIVDFLYEVSGLSKNKIKQVMQKGAVWLTHGKQVKRVRRANKELVKGDELHLYYDERVLETVPPEPTLISDELEYSIWFKPYGMRSQGSRWGDHCAISRWVECHIEPQRPAFIVHRLDRAASGVMIIAHSKKTAAAFSRLFQSRDIKKTYRVRVHGCFPESASPISYDDPLDNKKAVSHVRRLSYDSDANQSLLKVEIETGRKHQIRRHLSMHGFPVVGDRFYGGTSEDVDLDLVAYELQFLSPLDNKSRKYTLPEAFC